MSLHERIQEAAKKLRELQDGTDDRVKTTPSILKNIADFIDDELNNLIDELDDAARDAESLEEQIEELGKRIEELENAQEG
jgi:prefoldin subunit 5